VKALRRPSVCLVTDRTRVSPDARTVRDEIAALERWLDEAIDAGVDVIQIRERNLDSGPLASLVRAVAVRARLTPTLVLVNDRADVALVAEASGVHLRSAGPAAGRTRALGPKEWIVGRSVHAPGEAVAPSPPDYLLFGAVFPSASKPESQATQGTGRLRAAVEQAGRVPVLAIGGITVARAALCKNAGAAGVAAIGLFLPAGRTADSLGARQAVEALREVLQ
jgi:thiamine-phosphate pyrophosphorylase